MISRCSTPTSSQQGKGAALDEVDADPVRHAEIVVRGEEFVSVRLAPDAYAQGFAVALPLGVSLARPTGFNRADATSIRISIEGANVDSLAEGT